MASGEKMNNEKLDISKYGIKTKQVHRNPSTAALYESALKETFHTRSPAISSQGALIAYSGAKTGRSPQDKRIVKEENSEKDVWWGKVNIPLSEKSFETNLVLAKNFLNTCEQLYVVDAFAGWRPAERIKIRVICSSSYHALFMHNMLIRPTEDELKNFGEPDWIIYNAGKAPADPHVEGVTSETSIDFNFKKKEIAILGTEYAGCMKKGVFTVINYILPKKGILTLHAAANQGPTGDTALFLGLSGTGKTTLSADPTRSLIGDDEHAWDDEGLFNIEGGCYAKVVNLSKEKEPDIWNAIRFGSVLENVVYDPKTHEIDFNDISITENTRVAYPLEFIEGAKIPAIGTHPKNIIFLTCDAYGVLPPISKLEPEQAMYHFISGYSAKVAGTEQGVNEPVATFSACFGAAFMVLHPMKYAELLRSKMKEHNVNVWLINTGWTCGGYGIGNRVELKMTRAMIKAAFNGSLDKVDYVQDPIFNLKVPLTCPEVPSEILIPKQIWKDKEAYQEAALKLAQLFKKNFEQYHNQTTEEVLRAGPK